MHPAARPDFWHERWTTNQIGFHEGKPNAHLQAFWSGAPGARVLVPLAGKSHDLEWLATQSHEVVGVELSPIACEAWFAERGLSPDIRQEGKYTRYSHGRVTLLQGDIFDLEGHYDLVWDRAAMIALPPEVRGRYAELVRSRVKGGLLVTLVYDQNRRQGPPFSVPDAEVRAAWPQAELLHRAALDEERWKEVGFIEDVVWRL